MSQRLRSPFPFRRSPGSERRDWAEISVVLLLQVLGRLSLAVFGSMTAMYLFLRLAVVVRAGETQTLDEWVLAFLRDHRQEAVFQFMTFISWLGSGLPQTSLVAVCFLGLVAARRLWPDAFALILATGGGMGLIIGLKRLFGRPRPEEVFSHLGYAFPSGHSFFAVVIYGLIAYWLGRDVSSGRRRLIWGIAVGMILLMGFSRMYVSEHYPTDVAAGYALAVPWLWGCLAIPTAFHRRGRSLGLDDRRNLYRSGRDRLLALRDYKPDLIALAVGLARDRRVSRAQRAALGLTANYLAMPFDFIPDTWAGIGSVDDLALAAIVLNWVHSRAPQEAMAAHWAPSANLPELLREMRAAVNEIVGRS